MPLQPSQYQAMAIPHDPPGVMASIYVDGRPLQEYVAGSSDTKGLAEQYVEARDGFEFEIWIRLAGEVEFRGDILGFCTIVDGNTTDQAFVTKKFVKDGKPLIRQGWVSSKGKVMKYSFKTLETTENDGSDYKRSRVAGLGSIVIEVHHMRGSGVSHSVSYSETATLKEKECRTRRVTYVDPEKVPAGTIVFHYRSLETLLSMGVIRKPTSRQNGSLNDDAPHDKRSTAGRDLEDGTRTTAALIQKIKPEKEANQPRRRKRPSDEEVHIDLDDDGNLVREYVVKKPKASGEVVDLT
ncbi:uncharacterized protein MYCFIDRAFT_195632 [Pseudocercospora fijiensis CIRAD86]|uniref:DUF7918 domain-containing protein n=1 Tax=Pseudocercospora fijiensis (strain CIRAD86) TaxID=383855 RepID=M2Z497_PSEFD|nr:uncharacterized protein MYCFIDRAFT_195632 [Pseudocercospora fijiensis CIRAD86]EME84640.1 hypothetical protein MYCFIDRAFT_195632 [Pseudocercospora fijiensis CIRAD86]